MARHRAVLTGIRLATLLLVLFCLFRPVLVVKAAVPQQNFLGVLVDDSRSMQVADENGQPRSEFVKNQFGRVDGELLTALGKRFVVRLFRFSSSAERLQSSGDLKFEGTGTHLGDALDRVRDELSGLPVAGLVVVSDGADNASPVDFASTLSRVESSNVVVYSVGLLDTVLNDGKPDRLRQLAQATGGSAFFPKGAKAVSEVLRKIADDIRHAYVIAYEPTDAVRRADVHRVRVTVEAPQRVIVRTRSGYRAALKASGEAPNER